MSAAIKRNWKTIVPLLTLLLAVLFGAGLFSRLRADDPPQYPVLLLDTNTQAFEHLAGVDQMFQFTLTEASDVVFFATNASPDTALLLYGPNDATLLVNAHWPDLINNFRLLNQSAATALPAGTYYLSVSEVAGGIIPLPFAVSYFAYTTGTMPAATVPVPPVPVPPAEPPTIPVLTLSTNVQSFTHTPGVDQTYQFTLTERSDVIIVAADASVDTAMSLYGPNDTTLLLNAHWPDFFTGTRVLDQTGVSALEAGTYFVTVADLAGGLTFTPFTVQYSATPAASPPTETTPPESTMPPDAPVLPVFIMPAPADYTNNLVELVPNAEWQSFDYVWGTTQWVFFTFTQRTDLSVFMDFATPDTQLLLYGPDNTTNIASLAPANFFNFWRVLDASGERALLPGTYVLGVIQSPIEPTADTYPVWFLANPTPEPTTNTGTMPEGGIVGVGSAPPPAPGTTTYVVAFVVTNFPGAIYGVPIKATFTCLANANYSLTADFYGTQSGGIPFYNMLPYQITMTMEMPWGVYRFHVVGCNEGTVQFVNTNRIFYVEPILYPYYGVSGQVKSDIGQPIAGVQFYFDVPPLGPAYNNPVFSTARGTWTNRLFAGGIQQRVTPFLTDSNGTWAFTPASLTFNSGQTNLNFTGKRFAANYMWGSVYATNTYGRVAGVKIAFVNKSFYKNVTPSVISSNPFFFGNPFNSQGPCNWYQSGFASNTAYTVIPSVSSTGSAGGKWTFSPTSRDVTNFFGPIDFTAAFEEDPANRYTLSGKVVDTATGNGVPGVTIGFGSATTNGGNVAVPAGVLTKADGTWMQTGFQKTNIAGMATYLVLATQTNAPGCTAYAVEDITTFGNGANSIILPSIFRKTEINFLVTQAKEAVNYTVMLASNLTLNASDWANLTNGLRQAANYFNDATDGQMIIRSFAVSQFTSLVEFNRANIQLLTSGTSEADLTNRQIHLSASDTQLTVSGAANRHQIYETLVHEMGHLEFGLWDEYTVYRTCSVLSHITGQMIQVTNGVTVTNKMCNHTHGSSVTQNDAGHGDLIRSCMSGPTGVACIMQNNRGSEFCVAANHQKSNAQEELNHQSCWETIATLRTKLMKPIGLPLPGPGATAADSKLPLPGDKSAGRQVIITANP